MTRQHALAAQWRRRHFLALPMLHSSWLAIAGRALATAAFSTGIALALTLAGHKAWDSNLVYSLSIGVISCLSIDLGRLWLTRGQEIPWPQGLHGLSGGLLVAGGSSIGFVTGMALGNLYTGREWFSILFDDGTIAPLVIAAAASLSITFFYHSRGKARFLEARIAQAQRDAAEARLKLLETQLEPHMMFNTLANLRVLVATDPARAQTMLDHLIDYLRSTLGASRATLHPLADEFARLDDYLALMAVRMGPRLAFTLDLPPALHDAAVPPLLLQPLVENAIRHGLEPQIEGGQITVTARLQRSDAASPRIHISVSDTGAGLPGKPGSSMVDAPPLQPIAPTDRHFGLQQVRDRLHTLYGHHATLDLIANSAGGACAAVTFPLKPTPHDLPTAPCADR